MRGGSGGGGYKAVFRGPRYRRRYEIEFLLFFSFPFSDSGGKKGCSEILPARDVLFDYKCLGKNQTHSEVESKEGERSRRGGCFGACVRCLIGEPSVRNAFYDH